jgi:sulfur-carrier protein
MVRVRFPTHLRRHFPAPPECEVEAATVAELIERLEGMYPGLTSYLVHEDGSLRQHVNVFIGERFIRDRRTLTDAIPTGELVSVMQALSGG